MTTHHLRRLHAVLSERDRQPFWRKEAARCAQYYDGRQLPQSVINDLEGRGHPVLITNLVQPTINGVLGMEARTRTDWFVRADDDEFAEVAEGLNQRVNEGLRTAKADRACAEAYKGEIISGLGWVEVRRNSNPLGSKYLIKPVHRDEISFDWKTDTDLHNCEWLMRERWVSAEETKAQFPKHKDVIENSLGQWNDLDNELLNNNHELLSHAYDEWQYGSSTRGIEDWVNMDRKQVKVYELYYRVWEDAVLMALPDGQIKEVDTENPMHIALIASGRVSVVKRKIPKLRLSWYVGPHHIKDMASPHPHNHYPYVPFFGAREDQTLIPYGLVRSMLSPQDEINFRRIKLTAQLNYKRIIMDDDATEMSDDDLVDAVHANDGIVRLNPKARREGGGLFKVETDQGIASQQFNIMADARSLIQDVAGIYNAMLGKESSATSGVAINSLVEQGATTLADINDNYRDARQMVGELILAHEVEELARQENVQVVIPKRTGQQRKVVTLNARTDEGKVSNAVAHAKTQVVMGEIQQSPGYKAQVSQMLTQFIGQLPGEVQVACLDIVIEQLDLPEAKKEQLLERLRKVTGDIDPNDMSEEQAAALTKSQQMQELLQQLEIKTKEAELAVKQAESAEKQANAEKRLADAQYSKERAETEDQEQQAMRQQQWRESRRPPPPPIMN